MIIDPAFDDRMADLVFQARVCWSVAGVSGLMLLLVALVPGGKDPAGASAPARLRTSMQRLRNFHGSESAIASMEFLMVFMPFLFIVLIVWQMAFMFNAQIQVGYAAFTAARSASVMIPADLEKEKEWELNKQSDGSAEKWASIRRAALPGLISISPGDVVDGAKVLGKAIGAPSSSTVQQVGLLTVLQPLALTSRNRMVRAGVKAWYAQLATEVLVDGKDHKQAQNFKGKQTVAVTVNYRYWLNVPMVGRLLDNIIDNTPNATNNSPSIMLSETIHMKVWSRLRAIEPCND